MVMTIVQSQYTADALDKFGLDRCNPVQTPAEFHVQVFGGLQEGETALDKEDHSLYRTMLGTGMFLAINTR